MTLSENPALLDLNGPWSLRLAYSGDETSISLPGDVHSALLAAEKIPDPYYGLNEEKVNWVGESDWVLERVFPVDDALLAAPSVCLEAEALDTVCEIFLNDQPVGKAHNRFRLHRWEVKPFLVEGENRIRLLFRSAVAEMKRLGEKLPYPIPHSVHGQKIPHWNLLRKPMCHAGWDWGICLPVTGSYGALRLRPVETVRLDHVYTTVEIHNAQATVEVMAEIEAWDDGPLAWEASLDGRPQRATVQVRPGLQVVRMHFQVDQPRLWWPNGMGAQPLYPLEVRVGKEVVRKKIGLRTIEVDTTADEIGRAMTFRVNGVPVFAKGANWIPSDALPARQTPARERALLQDACRANMNMIRLWGGGQYEADSFYETCDELGLLIWHDMMFSCALYPADPEFLHEVRLETAYQVRRLRDHPSVALWCGDNECVGAFHWFEESKKNRDRYLLDWDRLNRARAEEALAGDPTRVYWPSSPCAGPSDFSDTFHQDGSGDMHYWAVWHEGKTFDSYLEIRPRFCSEFGYQSFPSLATTRTFCPPDDFNITAPVMEFHQRNNAGNRLINDMFSRYFRMPAGFEETVYLSQVQQAVAIKTAVEYWRTLRPRCMGTLYWQLNDVWPVASWASLEYGGRWKQLHHHARRFYAPVIATVVQREGQAALWVVNDLPAAVDLTITAELWSFDGKRLSQETISGPAGAAASAEMRRWTLAEIAQRAGTDHAQFFLQLTLEGQKDGKIFRHENTHFFTEPKRCPIAPARIETKWDGRRLTLQTDAPAFFVFVEKDAGEGEFCDNSFTLLPGKPRTLLFEGAAAPARIEVRHLAQSFMKIS